MKFEIDGVTVELGYDSDHFPVLDIDVGQITDPGNRRPMIQISVNGVEIFGMRNPSDERWSIHSCPNCGSESLEEQEVSINGDDGFVGFLCEDCGWVTGWRKK